MMRMLTSVFNKKYTPSDIFRTMGFLGRMSMKQVLVKRLQLDVKKKDFPAFRNYFIQMYSLPISSEKALFNILKFDKATLISTVSPVEKSINENKATLKNIQILFFYGDRDWNEHEGAFRLSH